MARRVEEGHPDVAHLVLFAVGHGHVRELDAGALVEQDRGPRGGGQPPGAGQVICLDVGLDDVGDAHGLVGRGFEIGLDVKLWIHHSARSGAPSAEQIAGAAGLRGEELAKDHGVLPS